MRQQRYTRSTALLLVLLLSLVSCGKTTTGDPPSSVISLGTPTSSNLQGVAIGGLYVTVSNAGCTATANAYGANLVLATSQPSLDAGEAQQVSAYLQQVAQSSTTTVDADSLLHPPAALRWVPGGTHCSEMLGITNTSNTSIQINGVGFQASTTPQPNANQYRLIQVATNNPCPPNKHNGCGHGNDCSYTAQAALDASGNTTQADARIQGRIQSDDVQHCPMPFILQPQAEQDIVVSVMDRHTRALIYHSVMPTIDEVTSNGAKHLVINKLKRDFTFTSTDRFPCYTFQGNMFVLNRSSNDCI